MQRRNAVSHRYTRAISERFRDRELIYKALHKFAIFTFTLHLQNLHVRFIYQGRQFKVKVTGAEKCEILSCHSLSEIAVTPSPFQSFRVWCYLPAAGAVLRSWQMVCAELKLLICSGQLHCGLHISADRALYNDRTRLCIMFVGGLALIERQSC